MSGTLADRQAAFMRALLDEGAPLLEGWGNRQAAGMGVYRGNYRGALMTALEATYERTARYVGEAPFKRAGAHHLIAHPPGSWTIDDAGAGFDQTCAELFTDNPEVAELAWLEWAMQLAATAPDIAPMDAGGFAEATAGFDDAQWMGLRLNFLPRATARETETDLKALWNALTDEGQEMPVPCLPEPAGVLIWREGERPTFLMVDADTARAFAAMQGGASYGEAIMLLAGDDPDDGAVQDAAMRAGQMLGLWLNEGIIAGLT
jgi:hypothetical protein